MKTLLVVLIVTAITLPIIKDKEIVSELANENKTFLTQTLGEWEVTGTKEIENEIIYYIITYKDSQNKKQEFKLYNNYSITYSFIENMSDIITNEIKQEAIPKYLDKNNQNVIQICRDAKMKVRIENAEGILNNENIIHNGITLYDLTYQKLMTLSKAYYLSFEISYPNEIGSAECTSQVNSVITNILNKYPNINMLFVERKINNDKDLTKSICYVDGKNIIEKNTDKLISTCETEINYKNQ